MMTCFTPSPLRADHVHFMTARAADMRRRDGAKARRPLLRRLQGVVTCCWAAAAFSAARRLASASIVCPRSGCFAISIRKSTRSSTSSVQGRVVVIVAVRIGLPSRANSPKKAPSVDRICLPVEFDRDFTRRDEIHAVADLAAAHHHGARRQLDGAQHVGDVGDRCRAELLKNGTLLTVSQVLMKLARRVSAAKPVARIPVHRPNTPSAEIITSDASNRPPGVIGTRRHSRPSSWSRRPTTAPRGRCRTARGCTSRSSTWIAAEAMNTRIRNRRNTLASGPASLAKMRRSCRKPPISGTGFSVHSTASSQALRGCAPAMTATVRRAPQSHR